MIGTTSFGLRALNIRPTLENAPTGDMAIVEVVLLKLCALALPKGIAPNKDSADKEYH